MPHQYRQTVGGGNKGVGKGGGVRGVCEKV